MDRTVDEFESNSEVLSDVVHLLGCFIGKLINEELKESNSDKRNHLR